MAPWTSRSRAFVFCAFSVPCGGSRRGYIGGTTRAPNDATRTNALVSTTAPPVVDRAKACILQLLRASAGPRRAGARRLRCSSRDRVLAERRLDRAGPHDDDRDVRRSDLGAKRYRERLERELARGVRADLRRRNDRPRPTTSSRPTPRDRSSVGNASCVRRTGANTLSAKSASSSRTSMSRNAA